MTSLLNDNDNYDPEDVLFDSLQTLYGYQPITLTSAGSTFNYVYPGTSASRTGKTKITLLTPDSETSNWALHASSVWVGSTQLANHLHVLNIEQHLNRFGINTTTTTTTIETENKNHENKNKNQSNDVSDVILVSKPQSPKIQIQIQRKLRILELGASAGLPSILISKLYPLQVNVFVTDYPDERIISTLKENIIRNGVEENCKALPYAWGSDPSILFSECQKVEKLEGCGDEINIINTPESTIKDGFDMIIAADTLWNPECHGIFIDTLQKTLYKDLEARVHLISGLHTGRYTIDSFLCSVREAGFKVIDVLEREVVDGNDQQKSRTREWDVARAELEDEKERRSWAIWVEMAWNLDQSHP